MRVCVLFLLLPLAALATAAPAATIQATSQEPGLNDFTIVYDDLNGDGLFDLPELTSFSGLSFVPKDPKSPPDPLPVIVEVPAISGISLASETGQVTWVFGDGGVGQTGILPSSFTYEVTGSAVPLPLPLALLLGGLGALFGLGAMGSRSHGEATEPGPAV